MSRRVPQLGQRIGLKGRSEEGTVRYVGKTQFAAGTWVGVELEVANGKNDGSVQGVQYFVCKPKYGLFVPSTQVLPSKGKSAPSTASTTATSEPATPSPTTAAPSTPKPVASVNVTPSSVASSTKSQPPNAPSVDAAPATATPPASAVPPPATPTTGVGKPPPGPSATVGKPSPSSAPSQTPTSGAASTKSALDITQQASPDTMSPSAAPKMRSTAAASSTMRSITPTSTHSLPSGDGDARIRQHVEELLATNKLLEEEKAKALEEQKSLNARVRELSLENAKLSQTNESHRDELERELTTLRRELQREREAGAEKARVERQKLQDELEEVRLELESITLDKELAEERADLLEREESRLTEALADAESSLEALKEKQREVGLDTPMDGDEVDVVLLRTQNERLRDAVVRLKEALQTERTNENAHKQEVGELNRKTESLENKVRRMEEEIGKKDEAVMELKKQLDAAADSADMVESLTEKVLTLEERLSDSQQHVDELEEMRDAQDELEEGLIRAEREARAELHATEVELLQVREALSASQRNAATLEESLVHYRDALAKVRDGMGASDVTKRDDLDESASNENALENAVVNVSVSLRKARIQRMERELIDIARAEETDYARFVSNYVPKSVLDEDKPSYNYVQAWRRIMSKANVARAHVLEEYPLTVPSAASSASSGSTVNPSPLCDALERIEGVAAIAVDFVSEQSLGDNSAKSKESSATTKEASASSRVEWWQSLSTKVNDLKGVERTLDALFRYLKEGLPLGLQANKAADGGATETVVEAVLRGAQLAHGQALHLIDPSAASADIDSLNAASSSHLTWLLLLARVHGCTDAARTAAHTTIDVLRRLHARAHVSAEVSDVVDDEERTEAADNESMELARRRATDTIQATLSILDSLGGLRRLLIPDSERFHYEYAKCVRRCDELRVARDSYSKITASLVDCTLDSGLDSLNAALTSLDECNGHVSEQVRAAVAAVRSAEIRAAATQTYGPIWKERADAVHSSMRDTDELARKARISREREIEATRSAAAAQKALSEEQYKATALQSKMESARTRLEAVQRESMELRTRAQKESEAYTAATDALREEVRVLSADNARLRASMGDNAEAASLDIGARVSVMNDGAYSSSQVRSLRRMLRHLRSDNARLRIQLAEQVLQDGLLFAPLLPRKRIPSNVSASHRSTYHESDASTLRLLRQLRQHRASLSVPRIGCGHNGEVRLPPLSVQVNNRLAELSVWKKRVNEVN